MDQIISSSGESVKVFVRVRPPDPNLESGLGHGVCLDVTSDSTLMVYSKPDPKVFTFDHVASRNITQEDVFSSIGRPIIDSCMHGYNGTIFAYGQTGSGKTFTMIGPPSEESVDTFTHELRGIIPRSFEYLFSFINRNKQKYGELVEFLCKCSFLEIYNEQVFDLLDPASVGLHLRENMKHGVYVDGLTEISVSSARDSYQVLSTGWVNRKVASTSMNRESSRSHAVFTLSIESKKREVKDAVAKIRTSVLNLVDLAGSERQRDTHAAGLRLKEAGSINKSLSALGNVIMALVDIANGKSRHVHYRDSKLTFLLRDSLGGNAKTNLVANVHPSARCFGESLSTLNFARRAKMIRNKAVINEDSSGNVLQLQTEIKRLRSFIERYKAGLPPDLKNSLFSSPSPISSDTQADETVTIMELKNMLTSSMEARDRANVEKTDMCSRVERLKELNERKDKFLQSTKMILKFRESHISNLEKARKTETQAISESAQEETNKLLREEIQQLKYLMEHHPEKIRMMHENLGLKAEIKKLQSSAGIKGESSQLARSHHYTLQLEKQLRHYLARNGTSSPMAGCQAPNTPTKTTFDLEGLQARCKQLKEELDAARISLNRERETSHLRVSIVETSLTAAKKANVELERSIEALKLKNNVEKATLNDIHMTTIKMILTPKRDRNQLIRNKSYSCTPNSFTRHDSLPFPDHSLSSRHSIIAVSPTSKFSVILENEKRKIVGRGRSLDLSPDTSPNYTNDSTTNHTPGSTPCAKKAKFSKSAVVSSSCDDDALMSAMPLFSLNDDVNEDEKGLGMVADVASEEGEAEELDEVQIQGALTEELKRLQDRNRSLQQELEELEASVVHLSHGKSALEAQLEEVTQLSKFDREGYYEKEQGYLEKVSDMASQIAHLKSTYGVMESEVQDLRVCLKSADKELKEVKEEKRDEKRSHDGKISTYIHRITELESLYSMEESKYNRAVEELQNLQVEVDTLREEMTFKEHRLCELEDALRREKALVSSQEGEIQNLLDKLALEVEGTTRLSLELQEGHNGKKELVKTINENHHLHSEVEQLEGELQSHLQTHKQQMEKTELSLNTLLKQKSTDEAAIAGFVATIQELRGENTRDECRLLGLERELEESGKELSAAVSKNDTMRGEVIRLQEELCENATTYGRELSKKEAEREIVCEDLDRLNDQYQQLNMEFEEQARKLTSAHGDLEEARRELGSSEGEVKRLLHKMDRSSLSKRLSTDEEITEVSSEEEIEQLKWQLDQAATMIQSYEMSREEKNSDISRLKDHVLALERLEDKHVSQQGVIAELHYELSQKEEKVNVLGSQCQAAAAEVERMMKESRLIAAEKTRLLSENAELLLKCGQQTEQVTALTEQIERYKTSEESLFQEKEAVRSQLEMFHEEKAKLSKECEKLVKENAAITGHQNIRQKIQYHAAVKIENQKLKEEVIQLHSRLKWKTEQVDKLQSILTENGLESKHSSNTKRTTHNDPPQVNFKENIVLK